MTRPVKPKHPTATPGAGFGSGHDSSVSAGFPAPAFSRKNTVCHGQICLWCDHAIYGPGVRLVCLAVTTHAHRACAPEALLVLA